MRDGKGGRCKNHSSTLLSILNGNEGINLNHDLDAATIAQLLDHPEKMHKVLDIIHTKKHDAQSRS